MTDTLESLLKAEPYAIPDPRSRNEHGITQGEIPDDLKCPNCGSHLSASHFWATKQIGCFSCYFWLDRLKEDHSTEKDNFVIVNGTHYCIAPDQKGGMRGYGGAQFIIKFKDGRTVVSHNLWCQGDIPPRFRPFMPDNAEFVR